jgi:hypothetical protein
MNDSDTFLVDASLLYESEQSMDSMSDPSDSSSLGGVARTLSFTEDDPDLHGHDSFDWLEAIPGNGWTPQSLTMSSQGSTSSSPSPSRRRKVSGGPETLALPSLEAAAGGHCKCALSSDGLSCMRHFDIGDIFRFRHARTKMSSSEVLELRQNDMKMALQTNHTSDHCLLHVKNQTICLRAYCMLFDINYASMKRSWRRLSNGSGCQYVLGRPRGSFGGVLSSVRGMQAYAWLKTWIEISGDQDPVGHPYKYIISFVLPADLYEEYAKDFAAAQLGTAETVLSGRAFARVWGHFKSQEKVRVRRKANTTTKCQGTLSLVFYPTTT